jgi:dolichyl-diphosphooligosaccharide--protein glycosyltransferase
MAPLKSLEQLVPLAIFLGMQLLEYVEIERRKRRLSLMEVWALRIKLAVPCAALAALLVVIILPTGYFGPLSSRVRGLFLKHTRTGNPLVDSVAEHQPGSTRMYHQYLHHIFYLVPIGFFLSLFTTSDSNSFLVLYGLVAYFFASKMARLVILLGPPAASLAGVAIGNIFTFCLVDAPVRMALGAPPKKEAEPKKPEPEPEPEPEPKKAQPGKPIKPSQAMKNRQKAKAASKGPSELDEMFNVVQTMKDGFLETANAPKGLSARLLGGALFAIVIVYKYQEFYQYAHMMAESSSRPQIMFKATMQNGQTVMVDDYREAYLWLKAKTPEDARVMAWWDYGYQITGIANRTSIADGNTWNHEHIATLGRILTAPEEEAHSYARHLADYVLVWAGGGGDDLAKSPHLARIGNSVFHGHCGNDPTCSNFGFYQDRSPTPMMAKSLLFKLVSYGRQGVTVNQSLFEHVYTSKYGKVRIFKVKRVSLKSKNWVADPENKICDAPGSWYCVGQYPPALKGFIESRHNFKQLEDFNTKRDEHSKKYHEEYMRRMAGGRAPADRDEV